MTELEQLKAEFERIKTGIRQCNICMIVDGNDMIDWGWTTQALVNRQLHKKSLSAGSGVSPAHHRSSQ